MKNIIGRTDIADFPLLDLYDIEVKIDTGAYTSSIHCSSIRIEDNYLKCHLLDERHPSYHGKELVFDEYDVKVVKSSNGIAEPRYRIKTQIQMFEKTYDIFLTLSDRKDMRYPVLLGRTFLSRRFVVDINKKNLSYKQRNKPDS